MGLKEFPWVTNKLLSEAGDCQSERATSLSHSAAQPSSASRVRGYCRTIPSQDTPLGSQLLFFLDFMHAPHEGCSVQDIDDTRSHEGCSVQDMMMRGHTVWTAHCAETAFHSSPRNNNNNMYNMEA